MAMTRKNYVAFAGVIKSEIGRARDMRECQVIASVARELAAEMKRDNSAFRYDTFFAACGLDGFGEM